MRAKCPVARSEFMGWSLFDHGDIASVLADPTTFSNTSRFPAIPNGMDPPIHAPYYKALGVHFNEAQMALLEPRVREIAVDLLGPLVTEKRGEFIADFAERFALKTLCAMLGWPDEQWECLSGWTHDSQDAAFNQDGAAGAALADLFSRHVKANLDKHRASTDHAADATDALMQMEVDGKRFNDDEIVTVLRNWAAGHGTVVGALGIVLSHLAQTPDMQARLRGEPSLIPAAIEEILRADGPLVANRRTTTREVEIQGRTIAEGQSVSLMWIAANRDPDVFAEPDTVDIERDTDAGMVWGQGIHLCLGAGLARLEMRVAVEELLARTTRFEVAGDPPKRAVYPSNGLVALQLRLI